MKQYYQKKVHCDINEAIIALGQFKLFFNLETNKEVLELIYHHLLNDPNDHVRWYAAQALGFLGLRESISFLKKALGFWKNFREKRVMKFSVNLKKLLKRRKMNLLLNNVT